MSASKRRVCGALFVFAVLVFSEGACRAVVGIEERSVGVHSSDASSSSVGVCGTFQYPGRECADCIDAGCCNEAKACAESATCSALYSCRVRCAPDDDACRARCAHHGGYVWLNDDYYRLTTCLSSRCASECGSPCGVREYRSASCEACARAICCAEEAACGRNYECDALDRCPCVTGSPACIAECEAAHPDGVEARAAAVACREGCAKECSASDWSCLGSPITWLRPTRLAPITVSIGFVTFVDQKAHAGITVKACPQTDTSCSRPYATATADDKGRVVLTVPIVTAGFLGYFELSGGSIYPTLEYFTAPPFIEDVVVDDQRVPSLQEGELLAAAAGVALDPARGHVAVGLFDCAGSGAPGVAVSASTADSASSRFYLAGGIPSTGVTETELPEAFGGYLNLPARLVDFEASVVALGQSLGSIPLIVRPGTLTIAEMGPTP